MPLQDIIQTSFAAGEIGDSVQGRSDIAQWDNACAKVQNFIPRLYGSAISMPGTKYVATVSDSTLRTRLIPFVFNQTDSYVIEMGDLYMRFFTNRGQVITPSGSEDLSAYSANLIAHWKMNDNTNSTTVLDAVTSYDGSASTLTTTLSTTGIVGDGFNLAGIYHISVSDSNDFTRTASGQPMTIAGWAYYNGNGSEQTFISKPGEYGLKVNSSDKLKFCTEMSVANAAGTVLLLHCDGSDGSTTFTDSSPSAHTVTAAGNAQIDTAQKKFGTASGLFDGSGDNLDIADSADWDFGTDDFTIELQVRFASLAATVSFVDRGNGASYTLEWAQGTSKLQWVSGGGTTKSETWSPVVDTWYHVAITRSGTNLRMFINGNELGSATTDSTDLTYATEMNIASNQNSTSPMNGHLDEIRIVKGTAVWTANFTPPSAEYKTEAENTWTADTALTEGWNFLAVTFNGDGTAEGDCALYVNGELAPSTYDSDASFIKMENTTSVLRIGTNASDGGSGWADKMDNVAFLHQELTAEEIGGLYTSTGYQITTVFKENEIFDVHFTQLNDVIWLTHPNHPPQKLVRTSANEWTIADFAFTGGPFIDENTTATTITPSATSGTINLTASANDVFTLSGSTLGHHNAFWAIGGLAQTNATTGLKEEGFVQITDVIDSKTATATVIKNLKASTATTKWSEGAWSSVKGYPSKVVFHERRLWFARTNAEPQNIWGSNVFVFEDYSLDTQSDDDALNLKLASNESNEIQWLSSGRALVAGTYGGGFVLKSGDSSIITPNNVSAEEEIGFGSEGIAPQKFGNFLYFVQRFGKKLREMFYNFDLDSYKSVDRTILSPHILNDTVVDMGVQKNPDSVLYCVLGDGSMATMTREVDQELTAWAKHTTSGTYTSVAVIPSQVSSYDEVWVIVERWINGSQKKYIEFFEDLIVPDRADGAVYSHSALTYDAYAVTSCSNTTISLSATTGSVTLTSSTGYFDNKHIDRTIRAIDEDGVTLGEGTITATASTTSITLSITTNFTTLSYSAGDWGMSVRSVAGLDHLDAKTVSILRDGGTDSLTETVGSSSVTLTTLGFVVHVGLPYDQIIHTLPKEAATARGTAQSKHQRYNEIALKVYRSTQDFKYGTDADNLDDINTAFVPTVTTLYTGYLPSAEGGISMRGGYKRGAQIYIKNSNPLPIELLQIVGTLDTKDK